MPSTMNSLDSRFSVAQMEILKDDEPLPAGETASTSKVIDSRHQIAGTHCSDCATDVKDTRTLRQFVLSIP